MCDMLGIVPEDIPSELPLQFKIHETWVRDFFVSDAQERQQQIFQELWADVGDEVLVFDWTERAASRCGGRYLFNVLTGARRIPASVITETDGPYEVKPVLWNLKHRGVHPKVVYVDKECCGAWSKIIQTVWSGNTVVFFTRGR